MLEDSSQLLASIRGLLKQGAVGEAARATDAALLHAPDDRELHYLRGLAGIRLNDHARAIAAFERALSIDPNYALAWLALGNARARVGDFRGAAAAYAETLSREPDWTDAQFNLGLVCERIGELPRAARAFHAAWSRNPMLFDAAKKCVATLAQCVQTGETFAGTAKPPIAVGETSFTVVVCSIDDAKQRHVEALYHRLFEGAVHEIVVVRNPRSLAWAYNKAIANANSDVVVLSHDDIDILAPDFAGQLCQALQTFEVVGVVGSTSVQGPAVGWSGHPHLRGWITHHASENAEWNADVLDPRPTNAKIALLDGVLIAAHRGAFVDVPFDEVTFDGFHLYDLDWSYRASCAGYRLGTIGNLRVVHASRGTYDDAWQKYADRFCQKHRIYRTEPAPASFFGASFSCEEHVRCFFDLLIALSGQHSP